MEAGLRYGEPWRSLATICVLRELAVGRQLLLGAVTLERYGERESDAFRRGPRSCL